VSGAPAVREQLSGVIVEEINAQPSTPAARMAAQIQNDLRFNFTGGGVAGSPSYRLRIDIAGLRATVSTTNVSGLPINENFVLNASYRVVEIATGRTVLTGRTTTTVSYDPAGTQRFARISGMMDAERRAAKVISDNVTTRLASYFVSGG
jgi:LPS-assembly lipoprotein